MKIICKKFYLSPPDLASMRPFDVAQDMLCERQFRIRGSSISESFAQAAQIVGYSNAKPGKKFSELSGH